MGLKEILAAKKAAAAAQAPVEAETEVVTLKVPTEVAKVVEAAPPEKVVSVLQEAALEEQTKIDPKIAKPEKVLTFAEKMALKRKEIQAAQATTPPPAPTKVEIDPDLIPENEEDAQAYVDIKQRIHNLESMFEDDLKNAMSDLKAALKKNPNATELMLDSDVGKMVIALRRMTHVAVVEAEKEKKPGRAKKEPKAKEVALTKEQIEAAFNEI